MPSYEYERPQPRSALYEDDLARRLHESHRLSQECRIAWERDFWRGEYERLLARCKIEYPHLAMEHLL